MSSAALIGVWRPTEVTEIAPFWSRIDITDEEAEALVIGDGSSLPAPLVRRRFLGQPWADFEVERLNYGVLARSQIEELDVRAGLFHSANHMHEGYSLFLESAEPGVAAERFVVADPAGFNKSTSGELTISRRFLSSPIDHRVQVSLRARSQSRRYGGSDRLALPDTVYGTQSFASQPQFDFGMQSNDTVRQLTAGVAYQGIAMGIGQVNVGVQKTDYRKAVETPGGWLPESRDQPWLFSAAAGDRHSTGRCGPTLARLQQNDRHRRRVRSQ